MATTRQSKKLIQEVNRESCEEAFAKYNVCISKLSIIEGKMNGDITKVKQKYEGDINDLQGERDANFEVMQTYAEANEELFEKKKSMEFTHGTIGFRTGTPKLKTIKGFTWESVKILVKKILPSYIRTSEEIAKDTLLADREKHSVKKKLANVGLLVAQDESFYVQPNLEEVANA